MELNIEFYKDSYNFPLSGVDYYSTEYKKNIIKFVKNFKEYHNKENLKVVITKENTFTDLFNRYKMFCNIEGIDNPIITEIKFNQNGDSLNYKILVKESY